MNRNKWILDAQTFPLIKPKMPSALTTTRTDPPQRRYQEMRVSKKPTRKSPPSTP